MLLIAAPQSPRTQVDCGARTAFVHFQRCVRALERQGGGATDGGPCRHEELDCHQDFWGEWRVRRARVFDLVSAYKRGLIELSDQEKLPGGVIAALVMRAKHQLKYQKFHSCPQRASAVHQHWITAAAGGADCAGHRNLPLVMGQGGHSGGLARIPVLSRGHAVGGGRRDHMWPCYRRCHG